MSRLGDAANRPEEDFVVVPATPEMQAESALLSTNAVVAWFEGVREDVPCHTVAAAFAATFGFRPANVSVVRHFPEQYLVRFMYQTQLCRRGQPRRLPRRQLLSLRPRLEA